MKTRKQFLIRILLCSGNHCVCNCIDFLNDHSCDYTCRCFILCNLTHCWFIQHFDFPSKRDGIKSFCLQKHYDISLNMCYHVLTNNAFIFFLKRLSRWIFMCNHRVHSHMLCLLQYETRHYWFWKYERFENGWLSNFFFDFKWWSNWRMVKPI